MPFIIYLQCLPEWHTHDLFLWLVKDFLLTPWISQSHSALSRTAQVNMQDSQCQTHLPWNSPRTNTKAEVSNAGFRCELDAKLLSPMNVKVISSGPMRWRSLQDKTSDFLFLSPDFALSLSPAEQQSCTFGTVFLVTQTDCSWKTFFLYPWNRQHLRIYVPELRNPK